MPFEPSTTMRLFLLALATFFCLQPQAIWAEAIPASPPPAEKSKVEQRSQRSSARLFKKHKKKHKKRRHPQRQQDAAGVLIFIGLLLLGLATIAASVVAFFLFSGVGTVILLVINILLNLILFSLLLAFIQGDGANGGWLIAVALIFWLALGLFTWGILSAIAILWIIGLVVLLIFFGSLILLFVLLSNMSFS